MKLLKLFIAVVILGSMAAPASASDGTINFKGRIINGTCDATTPIVVTLDEVNASQLASKNATAGAKDFQINLTNCGLSNVKPKVKVKFDNLGKNHLLTNASNTNKAENVGIGIYEDDGSTQITQAGFSKPVNVGTAQTGTLKFKAKYVAIDKVTVGTVQAKTTFTLHYE
ncbi:type 1 fimbrial protein [Xenorhabdus nematophila]|uniref:fimbrial protein n=1 Tax=Xenorhabdus nematophila TaxID=628 RepID=UPI00032754A5|nr:fimbrial protein [Xenorhabdus nematophila]CEF32680.1 putative Fimbrial subunit (pilin) [Xenorhabdus nematophila str. Websteri]AYA40641.1 type 1 fimbrial protein [Xenorhabdus nematophila]KHD29285.1 pilin [Xenorhabdus nematophila]MBA0019382.1 type 1 fimbrial protein [Xenorhabdus nematophila]MCB4424217.1 fimbrial protein [Xenorhabdus nematophila]